MKNRKKLYRRVDYQVTMIAALILTISFACIYYFTYQITHDDMIFSLKERSNSIYEYVDRYVDKSTFDQSMPLTKNDERYVSMKKKLEEVRQATNVRYIYTAAMNEAGDYIYLVDGLPSNSSDFRNPGDKIEQEIIPELKLALHNKIVMPEKIKDTDWGKIFVTYFPIHEDGNVVGVLGIEFDAAHQFQAFQSVQQLMLIIGVGALGAAACIALCMFKRISNPLFNDIKNTDYLTGLKSRNAFDIDVSNIRNVSDVGFIIADMNGLKQINDEQGHSVGDRYIEYAASILRKALLDMPVYRYGGDEFVAISFAYTKEALAQACEQIYKSIQAHNEYSDCKIELAIGYACFDAKQDKNLMQTFKRADAMMYEKKKNMKNTNEN